MDIGNNLDTRIAKYCCMEQYRLCYTARDSKDVVELELWLVRPWLDLSSGRFSKEPTPILISSEITRSPL